MGTIRVGSVVSDIRGKVGEEIYSRGPGGLQVRSVGSWTQPDTQRQIDQRTICAKLAVAWSGLLSEDQRAGWRAYAKQWPRVNRWGEPLNIGGYQAFFRASAYYFKDQGDLNPANPVTNGDLLTKDAPPGGPTYPPVVDVNVNFGAEDCWVEVPPTNYTMTDPAWLWLFIGKPVGLGVNYYNGPWRYGGGNYWNGAAWTSSFWLVPYPFPVGSNERWFFEAVMQLAGTGEVSTRGRSSFVRS